MGETSPPIGLLPLGTANVLAAEIGLSDSVEHLARDLIEGPLRAVWPGIANGRRFTMMAGVGFDASVVEGVSLPLKRHIGKGAYIVEAGRCFARLQPQRYRVEIDGTAFDAAATIICRGRRYGGRYVCAPEASVFEPRFEVCLFANARRRDILRGAVNLWRGRIAGDPNVRIVRGRRVVVTGPADPVQCDGNVVCRLPAEFTLADSPIEMIAPR